MNDERPFFSRVDTSQILTHRNSLAIYLQIAGPIYHYGRASTDQYCFFGGYAQLLFICVLSLEKRLPVDLTPDSC